MPSVNAVRNDVFFLRVLRDSNGHHRVMRPEWNLQALDFSDDLLVLKCFNVRGPGHLYRGLNRMPSK